LYKAYFDASFEWGSKTSSIAFVIYNSKMNVVKQEVRNVHAADNNFAEWMALVSLLQTLCQMKIEEVDIYGDNQALIKVVNGLAKKKRYTDLYQSIWDYGVQFKHISFNWISRNENTVADKLSRKVVSLDEVKKKRKRKRKKKSRKKTKINTYSIKPNEFDFNFRYKETKRKVIMR